MALSTLNSGAEYAKSKIAKDLEGNSFDFSGFLFRTSLFLGLGLGVVILEQFFGMSLVTVPDSF